MEIFVPIPVLIKIFSIVDSQVIKHGIFMAGSFAAVYQLVITFAMLKCVLKPNTALSLTIRNDVGQQKVKKNWEILPKVITIQPFP
jgi:hypothetical protein